MRKASVIIVDLVFNLLFAVLALGLDIHYLKSLQLTGDSKMAIFIPITVFTVWTVTILPTQLIFTRYYCLKNVRLNHFLIVKLIAFFISGVLFFFVDFFAFFLQKVSVVYLEHLMIIFLYLVVVNLVYFVMLRILIKKIGIS